MALYITKENVRKLDIIVVAGLVMDYYGVGIKVIDQYTDTEIYDLAQEIVDQEE